MAEHPDLQETRLFGDAPLGGSAAPSGSTCAVGDLLAARFRIIRFIARGGMGELYEAEDLELRERVALKAMRPEIAADEHANRRFRREVQLARQVTHPNICRIFDLFQHQPPGGRPSVVFVTMELLEGETLAERIRRDGRIASDAALPLVSQMASALAAAHQAGIVHRDFKSTNVMLLDAKTPGDVPRCVVTDFGIAYRVGEATLSGVQGPAEVAGTPDYMAPEQLEGGDVTAATDIYALGIVMYEMVTGARPFPGDTPFTSAFRRMRELPPSPRTIVPDLPPTWDMTIARCLSREPQDRFPDARGVVQALGYAEGGRGGLGHLGIVIGVAAIAITLVTAVGIYVSRDRETSPPPAAAAAPRPAPRRSVAVLGFRNVAGRPDAEWLSTAFAEMLTTELGAGEALRTIPGEQVDRVKVELGIVDAESYAGDTLTLIRNNLAADVVAFGSFVAVGGESDPEIRLDVRLQDARVGQILAQVSDQAAESQVLDMVSRVGQTLRDRMGLTPLSAGLAEEVRALQPATRDAARLYAEGLSRLRRFDALGARTLLERAAAEDPRFPMPQSAFELSSGLSREERLTVEATYREMSSEWKEALGLYRSLATFFPDNIEYALRLANAEIASGAAKDGLATVEALRAAMPSASDPRIDLAEAAAAETLSDFRRMQAAAQRASVAGAQQRAKLLVARAKILEGTALFRLGQSPAAVGLVEEARAIYQQAGDRAGVARALNSLGSILSESGDSARGITLYQEALTIARSIGNQNLVARLLNNLAIQERRAGNLDASLRLNREALAIRRETGDRTNLATSLNNTGNVLLDQGDLAGAAKHYHEAADIHREIGDRRGVARALHNAAVALKLQGELTQARSTNEEALSIRRGVDDPVSLANSLFGLADVVALQGELGPAQRMFLEALDIQRRVKGQRPIGYLLYQLGDVALLEGNLAEAKKRHAEALELRTTLGEKGTAAESRLALAQLAIEEGRAAEAETLARDALAVFTEQKATDNQASARALLARANFVQGRRTVAQREAQAARALVRTSANTIVRIPVLITVGYLDGLIGGEVQRKVALTALQALQREARERGIVRFELDAGFALAQLEARSSRDRARERLASLQKDARARGFNLYLRHVIP
jgi:tetratricopeptide (TPR) repeat protein/tRNA A-37 threonylcarbamoyl transferase component Bud32/TolB-like protein